MFIEEKNLQPTLVKPSDLVTDEPIQTKELVPLPVEPKDFQPIGFEPLSNYLTFGSIKATYVFVHHYHDLLVQDNNVVMSNDPNDVFGTTLIDAYLLGVSNLKGCVHSQPQSHFCMKQYKKSSRSSLYIFFFIFFSY
jgi:hypothetical protein